MQEGIRLGNRSVSHTPSVFSTPPAILLAYI
jgi:hypothetical protein